MKPRTWLSPPHTCGKELDYIQEAFATNWIAPLGPNVDGFEHDLLSFLGENKQVVALNTGTAALHLSLILLGIQPGDNVICQSMTFSASANPIAYLGAKPVFVDSEEDTWNMSPDFLEEAINGCIKKGKKPKAILFVDLYGIPAKINEILSIAKKYEIPAIEDAAEALGSTYEGRCCGTFADLAVLSFNGNKIITTSGGGALVCNTEEAAASVRFLSTQARDKAPHYQHSQIGYNYRMSNIAAGIGRGQMTVLPDRVNARRQVNAFYRKELEGIPGISIHQEPDNRFFSNHWLSCIQVDSGLTGGMGTEAIRTALWESRIESRPLWKPMHLQPVFKTCSFYGSGISDRLFDRGLCLPSGSSLKLSDLEEIVMIIKQTLKNC